MKPTPETAKHTRIEGVGFDYNSGGFAELIIDGKGIGVDEVAVCVNSHDLIVKALRDLVAAEKQSMSFTRSRSEASRNAEAVLAGLPDTEQHDKDCSSRLTGKCDCVALIPGAYPANDEADAREVELDRLKAIAHGVLVALKYTRGSEAQVRCLEEIGQDARAILERQS